MNKTLLKILVGLVALSLAICAAFFSIVGLSKLFAGAALAVIFMASTLEASKLVITSFLYRYWSTVNKSLRIYLFAALIVIAAITSLGIYGFLAGAYQTTKSKYDLSKVQVEQLTTQKSYYESNVSTFKTQLAAKNQQLNNLLTIRSSQEQRANQLVNSNRSSRSADRSARQTELEIKSLNSEIEDLNRKIIAYSDSASKQQVLVTQTNLQSDVSSELGSLSYISTILNVSMDNVVNALILLFIIVFDPLAICMVLAFNFMNNTKEGIILEKEVVTAVNPDLIGERPSETPRTQSETEVLDTITSNDEPQVKEVTKPETTRNKTSKSGYSGAITV